MGGGGVAVWATNLVRSTSNARQPGRPRQAQEELATLRRKKPIENTNKHRRKKQQPSLPDLTREPALSVRRRPPSGASPAARDEEVGPQQHAEKARGYQRA